jgi:type VI secretion system Hcp family effector
MAEDIPDVYLRFDGFKGECMDEDHPADKGWITIKSFTFGFGFSGTDGDAEQDNEDGANTHPSAGTQAHPASKPQKKSKRKKRAGMKSGPLNFDCISFTKASDVMSHKLMEACHQGTEIPKVDLEACRSGGGPTNKKVAFLSLTFEKVYLKSCTLNLTTDNLPSEDIQFEYGKVSMNCLWTDNETGQKLDATPDAVSWDLSTMKGDSPAPPEDGEF